MGHEKLCTFLPATYVLFARLHFHPFPNFPRIMMRISDVLPPFPFGEPRSLYFCYILIYTGHDEGKSGGDLPPFRVGSSTFTFELCVCIDSGSAHKINLEAPKEGLKRVWLNQSNNPDTPSFLSSSPKWWDLRCKASSTHSNVLVLHLSPSNFSPRPMFGVNRIL